MTRNEVALPTVATVKQGREIDRAGWPIDPNTNATLLEAQAGHLQRRFLLPAPLARAVAELHYRRAA
jgi:hypothetical protein